MSNYTFFIVEPYANVCVLTWTKAAATRVLHNGELEIELRAFALTTKARCVIVSFARLAQCPSSLIGGLIGLNRQLKERGGSLILSELNQHVCEQFARLQLGSLFEVRNSVADAITLCEEVVTSRGEHGEAETRD